MSFPFGIGVQKFHPRKFVIQHYSGFLILTMQKYPRGHRQTVQEGNKCDQSRWN